MTDAGEIQTDGEQCMDGRGDGRRQSGETLVDELFDVVSHSRRRFVLHVLCREERTDVAALAERLAARESRDGTATDGDVRRVRTALHHVHLPRLVHVGLVAYDTGAGSVQLLAASEETQSSLVTSTRVLDDLRLARDRRVNG